MTTAIIQARMTSTRLPGKIMRPILGIPALELLVGRLRRVRGLDSVVIATTSNSTDDAVEALAQRLDVGCFRGSEEDVLDRVIQAARTFNVDVIVEITGDCPLIDPAVVERVISAYFEPPPVDYASNVLKRTYPRGMDTQVFSRSVLEDVAQLTDDPVDHEHVSLYIYEHPERFTLRNVFSGLPEECGNLRLTLDTEEDFNLIRQIYEDLYPSNPNFGLVDILRLLDRRPELVELNRHIKQKPVR